MSFFSQAPFIRLLIPFIFGIIASVAWDFYIPVFVLAMTFLFVTLLTFLKYYNLLYRFSWVYGLMLTLFLFMSGTTLVFIKTEKNLETHFRHFLKDKPSWMLARVLEPVSEKKKSVKAVVGIDGLRGEGWRETEGKCILYLEKNDEAMQVKYGDVLLVKARVTELASPKNPGEFNYKRYLSFHNIGHQAYAEKDKWFTIKNNDGNIIIKFALSLREHLLNILKENELSGSEYAVGAALLIGYEEKLDPEITNAYANSGALHILSVSGLHVALVFLMFSYMLGFLNRIKNGKIIRTILLLLILWFYALLTGFSPSVLRAVTMFSFIELGRSFARYTNIYNTLAASAFLLLLFDPFLIFSVGFQLSYIAVLGIVFLYPKIYDLWETKNWLLDKIWAITCVSLAAQVATFPLALYYFHQFPNFFLLANLIVIPLSTAVLYFGIGLFIISKIAGLNFIVAKLLTGTLYLLNFSVSWIGHLPFSVASGIYITAVETWLIYLIIALFLAYSISMRVKWLYSALTFMILFLFLQVWEQYKQLKQNKIIVYNIPGLSAMDIIQGRKNYLIGDTILQNKEVKWNYYLRNNWDQLGVNNQALPKLSLQTDSSLTRMNMVSLNGKKILIVSNDINNELTNNIAVDYIVLSHNPFINMEILKKYYRFKKIIIDSSNSPKNIKKWKSLFNKHNILYYSVIDEGAFVESL